MLHLAQEEESKGISELYSKIKATNCMPLLA